MLCCWTGAFFGALLLTIAVKSPTYLQGIPFQPPNPNFQFGPPVFDPADQITGKLEVPKIEPIKIDSLFETTLPKLTLTIGPSSPALDPERALFARYVRDYEAKPQEAASFDDTTDYAVALVHLGRRADAIRVLLALETRRPGLYTTAFNLGTAYELTGNLEEALKWTGAGIERNPSAHEGTEWLHLAILRANLALQKNPNWLKTHSVLDGTGTRRADEIVRAIEYQLTERLEFVQPADPVVCDLFYQAALRSAREAGNIGASKRMFFAGESLRFGDWRKNEIAQLAKL